MPSVLGDRKFYNFPCSTDNTKYTNEVGKEIYLINYIRKEIIGADSVFLSQFGPKRVVYCDYIASGRSLKFIENYINEQVLPYYGSTHTTTSVSSLQTSLFRHEAREIIRNAVRASEHDRVIFTGSGTTSAINKLIHGLKLAVPTVLIDFMAHHSSLLPWREIGAKIIRIKENSFGNLDMNHLNSILKEHQNASNLIGCFTACSNITGMTLDQNAITALLHKYNALSFWDFATAAPYMKIEMNGDKNDYMTSKDAVFFSLHKFLGGVQTPGVLVAKKELFTNSVPTECGGGTVFFVTRDSHRYLKDVEEREEGGTPAIVESIRGGLVMQLKMNVTSGTIMKINSILVRKLQEFIRDIPQIVVYGPLLSRSETNLSDNTSAITVPILSFLVKHLKSGKYLHYNFVSALLNDLFGIQSRGGCACAGPYAQDLLGINEDLAKKFETALLENPSLDRSHLRRKKEHGNLEILRPGFVRINLPYTSSEEQVSFILRSIKMVCEDGWKLLPQYQFNPETSEFKHYSNLVFKERSWLQNVDYSKGTFEANVKRSNSCDSAPDYEQVLTDARAIFDNAFKSSQKLKSLDEKILFGSHTDLLWFLLPSEAQKFLNDSSAKYEYVWPAFTPPIYPLTEEILKERPEYLWKNDRSANAGKNELTKHRVENDSEQSSCLNENLSRANEEIIHSNSPKNVFADSNTVGDSHFLKEKNSARQKINIDHQTETELKNNATSLRLNGNTCICIIPEKNSCTISCSRQDAFLSQFSSKSESESLQPFSSTFDGVYKDLNSEKTTLKCNNTCNNSGVANSEKEVLKHCNNVSELNKETCSLERNFTTNSVKHDKTDLGKIENKTDLVKIDNKIDLRKIGDKIESLNNDESDSVMEDIDLVEDDKKTAKISGWVLPPKSIFNPTLQAIKDFSMISKGDRVLICLSGGKDSLSLLHTMRQFQFYSKAQGAAFTLGVVTVDPETSAYDPSPLIPYIKSLGVPYFYEKQGILKQAMNLEELNSICSFCSRMKRGRIYATARRENFNVVALGQHADDLAESFLMSVFHNGRLRTMKASYMVKEGDLRVIRPFIYVRETELRNFAETKRLPIIPENCPGCFEAPKERHRLKQVLAQQEIIFPSLFHSLKRALSPLYSITKTGLENSLFGKHIQNQDCSDDED